MTDSESQRLYRHLRALWNAPRRRQRQADEVGSQPFTAGRDPLSVGATIDSLTEQLGWTEPLAQHELFARWAEVVGPEVAAHSQPTVLEDGVLTVGCDSTSWATQLKLLRHEIAAQLSREIPAARVENIRFFGPEAPSWKKGPRATPGRGPRDTYG